MATRRHLRRSVLALGSMLIALGACDPALPSPPAIDDPITIRVTVEGPGRVIWGFHPLDCRSDCEWEVPGNRAITVQALPDVGRVFANWDGACDTLPNPCRMRFEDGDAITATFAPHALRFALTGDGVGAFAILGGGVSTACSEDCAVGLTERLDLAIIFDFDAEGSSGTVLGEWEGPCEPALLQPGYCLVRVSGATEIGKTWTHPPVAVPDAYETTRNATLVVDADDGVLANDLDTPDDVLRAELVTDVTNGDLELTPDGAFEYAPATGFVGEDRFSYRARDAFGNLSNVADVTIAVVNRPPVAVDVAYEVDANDTLTVPAPGVLENDTDPDGDPLTAILEQDATDGTLDLQADGAFSYTPNDGFAGTDTFTYRAFDGELDSEPATVTIKVTDR